MKRKEQFYFPHLPGLSRLRFLFFLMLLLLASVSCSISLPGLPSATPAAQPTGMVLTPTFGGPSGTQTASGNVPQPTTSVRLPPALVETDPLPNSTVGAQTAPVFYFNQPMQRASVEAALKVEPGQAGRFEWIDDATLRYRLSSPLKPGADLRFTLNAAAKAVNGLPLAQPVQVNYRSGDALKLAEQLPKPGVTGTNPTTAVTVTFTRPVVALGSTAEAAPAAFTMDPPAEGRGEWINTSTYVFYPQPALKGGTTYTVHLNRALSSVDGFPLAEESTLEWSFETAAPALLSITPSTERPIALDSPLKFTFNQPMDAASVQQSFSLQSETGETVEGSFEWNEALTEMVFTPAALLQRGENYLLALAGTAQSQGGAVIGTDYAAALATVPQFGVRETRPAAGEALETYSGFASISLNFSSPVQSGQDLARLITLSPPVDEPSFYLDPEGYQLMVSGYFQSSTSYTLSVSPELQDRWQAKLDSPFSLTFIGPPARPGLTIPILQTGSPALFVPSMETGVTAQATNLSSLDLARGSLTLKDFIRLATSGYQTGDWDWKTQADQQWTLPVFLKENVSQSITIPLAEDAQPITPGLYYFGVEPQPITDNWNSSSPVLLVVSPVQMVLKVSSSQAFIWAVDLFQNAPYAGAEITIYDSSAAPLGTCTTDPQGACRVSFATRSDPYQPIFAVHGQPGSADFSLASSLWNEGVSAWSYGLTFEDQGAAPQVYLYTDRPIYQPGQTVHFRAVVRNQDNGRYAAPSTSEIKVDIVSPYDPVTGQTQTLTTLSLPLDPFGSADGVYVLPAEAPVGNYGIRVQDGSETGVRFDVAEYRKPEIDLQAKFDQDDKLVGDALQVDVSAQYYFGAPAGNLPVNWVLYRNPGVPQLHDTFSVGKVDTRWLNPEAGFQGSDIFVMEGNAQTGPDGRAVVDLSGQTLRELLGDSTDQYQTLTLEATLTDESGLPVSARATTRLHPSPFYIGIRNEQWSGSVGQQITYQVRTVDWQGNPKPDQGLRADFQKIVWVQGSGGGQSVLPTYRTEITDIGSTDFQTSAQGEARLAFTPPKPGTYRLEVTGSDGAVSQTLIWVGGAADAIWPSLSNQRVLLQVDRGQEGTYQPGETAHIFIPNPYPLGALALVTTERANVMRAEVIQLKGASYDFALPIEEEDAPNIYVSVTILGRAGTRPDFRQGYAALKVDPAAQLLKVELQASTPSPQPGEEITLRLHAQDAQGQPVEGAFSLALVDKAVLALADANAPSIMDSFYGQQPLGVQTGLSLTVYAGRNLYLPPGRGGGGGDLSGQPVRSQFEDTAYWNAQLYTDATGTAQATVHLPDNLTTWVADARGLTEDTRVGQAQLEVVTSKPLLVRPVTPRFVVQGDHLELAAVVQNNTSQALKVSVRLENSGFTLDDLNQAVQPVEVQAGGRQRVSWWGTVQNVSALDLTYSVESGALQDAVRVENGHLPVLGYTSPQTFGAAGMLTGAEERVELISIPRSFQPVGAQLSVEFSPSLSAAILDGLKVLETYPTDFTEPVLSQLLPNLAAGQALNTLNSADEAQRQRMSQAVTSSIARLTRMQNSDGGWGWSAGYSSDSYLTSYVMLGLAQAAQYGFSVDAQVVQKGQNYLINHQEPVALDTPSWQLDRLALQYYALMLSGSQAFDLGPLYEQRERLSPWSQALLALTMKAQQPGDERASALISALQSSGSRSASGVNWQDAGSTVQNWSTPNFTTAVVAYAIAEFDPTSPVLVDAVRYLALNRRTDGKWASSYETAWVITAMARVAAATGDLQTQYTYAASLNQSPLINGTVQDPSQASVPVAAVALQSSLRKDGPNELRIQRSAGDGHLYYRAFLQVFRAASDAPAVQRGLSLTRQYYLAGQDCRQNACQPIEEVDLSNPQPVLVRLTLTVPEDQYSVVVEDYFPAGTEVLDTHLKTSQQNLPPADGSSTGNTPADLVDLANPFEQGWGWWYFNDPQVYNDHIRWVVDQLPAGTYELTYRLTPFLAGEFQVLPAHAWDYYFPDVEAASAGNLLKIH